MFILNEKFLFYMPLALLIFFKHDTAAVYMLNML